MKYYNVNPVVSTGLAAAAFSGNGCGDWPFNNPDNTLQYDEFAAEFGTSASHMIRVNQKHTSRVLEVTAKNAGEGVTRPGSEEGIDGLITAVPGLMLCVVTADCVPVFLLDPVTKTAGIVHSGWKGTVGQIAAKAVRMMEASHGADPSDVIACLGPHICGDCYETGDGLTEEFAKVYTEEELKQIFFDPADAPRHTDLGAAIAVSLRNAGLKDKNIHPAEYCTLHDPGFFSWRRGERGKRVLSAIMLK